MWKQVFGFALLASTHLLGQDSWCYIPDGQTIYSEVCCPDECCPPTCPTPCSPFPVLLVDLQGGVRRDSFSFSVQGPNGTPNHYISQRYTKIRSAVGAINVWFQIDRQWYLRGYADYASISHGTEKQTFNDVNGSMLEHYEQKANSGHFYDFLGGLGWSLPCLPNWFTMAAAGGYSRDAQHIKSHHAKLRTPLGDQGHVHGRHSTLQASWTGPWAGTDMAIRYGGLKVGGTFEYHWAKFRASEFQAVGGSCLTNCNNTNRFSAQGRGLIGVLSITQVCCNNWRFGFVGRLQYWKTRSGNYSYDGVSLKLNPVKWNSASLVANLGYRF